MRTHFLVKPSFQLRHLSWTLGVVVLSFLGCWSLVEGVVSAALARGGLSEASWTLVRTDIRLGFLVIFVIALALAAIENFLFFHRIAGPLFALERALRQMAGGDFTTPVRIRETDQLADLIKTFEDMRAAMRKQFESQQSNVIHLSSEIERCLDSVSFNNLDSLRKTLQQIRERVEKKAA